MPTVLLVLNGIAVAVSPWQKNWLVGWLTSPAGFTVMVNCLAVPPQVLPPLVKYGVTMIIATIGEVPVLVAVNIGIEPLPSDARPIELWLFVHV